MKDLEFRVLDTVFCFSLPNLYSKKLKWKLPVNRQQMVEKLKDYTGLPPVVINYSGQAACCFWAKKVPASWVKLMDISLAQGTKFHHSRWNVAHPLKPSQVQIQEPRATSIFLPIPPFPSGNNECQKHPPQGWKLNAKIYNSQSSCDCPRLLHSLMEKLTKVMGINHWFLNIVDYVIYLWFFFLNTGMSSVSVNNRTRQMSKEV